MDLKEMTLNDNRHPWELSRGKNLLKIAKQHIPAQQDVKVADVGAGDLYFTNLLTESLKNEKRAFTIYAIDTAYKEPIPHDDLIIHMRDVQQLENESMDCILLMDVLEHVVEDAAFLSSVLTKLKKGGILITTVPVHPKLFSAHDRFMLHCRRYDKAQLLSLMKQNQLEIVLNHYFFFSLYLVRWMQVKLSPSSRVKTESGIGIWQHSRSSLMTKCVVFVLNIDFALCSLANKIGLHLVGLSMLAVARKQG